MHQRQLQLKNKKKLDKLVADREYAERRVNELKKQLAGLRQEVDEKGQQRQELTEQVFILEHDIKAAESRLSELQGQILTAEEAEKIKGKKTLTGGQKGITYQEYLNLKATATAVEDVQSRDRYLDYREQSIRQKEKESEQKIAQRVKDADKEIGSLLQQINDLEKSLRALLDTYHLARELQREAEKRGYKSTEAILEDVAPIQKEYQQRWVEEALRQQPKRRRGR